MARLSDEEIEERRSAPEAEEMNHHPDLEISWNKVTVSITTH
jgi:pterin-4a-carbinolamine dehydratase